MADEIPWRSYSSRIVLTDSSDPFVGRGVYGPVRRNGRVHYRNYKRPIKHGLTFVDLMRRQLDADRSRMIKDLSRVFR